MHSLLQAAVPSLQSRPVTDDADTPIEESAATLQEALAEQRDALRRFIVLQLTSVDGGALAAHAFITESRGVLRDRGLLPHATWQFGLAAAIARELGRATARQLREAGDPGSLPAADLARVEDRVRARLASLGDDLRELLLAIALHALSMDEAGLLLTRRLPVARARIAHALHALRDEVQALA